MQVQAQTPRPAPVHLYRLVKRPAANRTPAKIHKSWCGFVRGKENFNATRILEDVTCKHCRQHITKKQRRMTA